MHATFVDLASGNEKEVDFYNNINDLSKKINMFNKDVKKRTFIARNGRISYFKKFNSSNLKV